MRLNAPSHTRVSLKNSSNFQDKTDVDLYDSFDYQRTEKGCSTNMKMRILQKDGKPFNIKSNQLTVKILKISKFSFFLL